MVDFIIALRYSVSFIIFSSDSCLLAEIMASMMMNFSSDLLSIFLSPFRIFKLEL